mmetsp:Transcript_27816/g.39196  ORF Transcript_27816/g.39196 Transcript_27816/m.39196 type:complete len:328 (+) Transcript_27816:103-1086(+)|eukprot:CAMPEP_0168557014 /NCGR_PEP_ID=MMETSP0413-20121227/9192_1 /TAXON_ID=136452 /ORGANISM="Filamoeba nolandi, Strain NC-AS-23-1" /LENGTH=327 /DNA_ID=CAMNT_0008588003 /DNA_START=82 /DNA_END=1065 /DNA_ORIENTATION=+
MADPRTNSLTKIEGGWVYETQKYGRILRTDDSHFQNLPDFPFNPNYVLFRGVRMHYLDEGNTFDPKQKIALCLHGEPSWCYLYRKLIPPLVKAGYRVIAPDFIGFGRSDKFEDAKIHNFNFARDSIINLIEVFNLTNITLLCQDWGGVLGLTIPMEFPERFKELIVMNTGIASGIMPHTEGFLAWQQYSSNNKDLDLSGLFKRSCPKLSAAECQAYAAPYPNKQFKAAVWYWPLLVPGKPEDDGAYLGRKALQFWSQEWSGKAFMAIGKADPVLGEPPMRVLKRFIRNCSEPLVLTDAGHFVQEAGEIIVNKALEYFQQTPAIKAAL